MFTPGFMNSTWDTRRSNLRVASNMRHLQLNSQHDEKNAVNRNHHDPICITYHFNCLATKSFHECYPMPYFPGHLDIAMQDPATVQMLQSRDQLMQIPCEPDNKESSLGEAGCFPSELSKSTMQWFGLVQQTGGLTPPGSILSVIIANGSLKPSIWKH